MTNKERTIEIKNAFKEICNDRCIKSHTISETNNCITDQNLSYTSHASDLFNLSSIATTLIQTAGRWCERYASDLLITWNDVISTLDNICIDNNTKERNIICFGFRTNGIDHDDYIYSNMSNLPEAINYYYHKIYAVVIDTDQTNEGLCVVIKLVDIQTEVHSYSYKHFGRFIGCPNTQRETNNE